MNTTNQDLLDLAQALQWLSPTPEINPLIVEDEIDPNSLDEEQAPIAAMYYIGNRIRDFRRQCLNALHRTPDQAHQTLERFIKNWHIDTLANIVAEQGTHLCNLCTSVQSIEPNHPSAKVTS